MKEKVFIVVYSVLSALFVVLLDRLNLIWTSAALFCTGYVVYRLADTRMWKRHGYPASRIPNRVPMPLDVLYFGAQLLRVWRLHRTLLELILPPHLICPPELEYLSLDQWRKIAVDYWPALRDAERNARSYKFHKEWLPAQGLPLPPVPVKTKS